MDKYPFNTVVKRHIMFIICRNLLYLPDYLTTLILVATDRILIHTGLPSMLGSNSGDHLLVRTSV